MYVDLFVQLQLLQSITEGQISQPIKGCQFWCHDTEVYSFLPMLKQNSEKGRTNELFKLPKTRTEKARNDFFFRTCRLANRIEKYIEFNTKKGLKNRVLNFIWKFVNERFDENNICSWHLCCDCQIFRNNRTIF